MNASTRINLSRLVNAFIDAGIIENVVEAPVPVGDVSWDDFDRISQANLLASAVYTAYAAVVNTLWREERGDSRPVFDASDDYPYEEDNSSSSFGEPLTLKQAVHNASVVRTMVRSYASDNKWLNGWVNLTLVKDEYGNPVLDKNGKTVFREELVKSFSAPITQFFDTTDVDEVWRDKVALLRAHKINVPFDGEGIDAVKTDFIEWLAVQTLEDDPRDRLTRFAEKVGDKKWDALKSKALSGKPVTKEDLRHWVLMSYSPKFQADAQLIRESVYYKGYKLDCEIEREEVERAAAELDAMQAQLTAVRTARLAKLAEPSVKVPESVLPKRLNSSGRIVSF